MIRINIGSDRAAKRYYRSNENLFPSFPDASGVSMLAINEWLLAESVRHVEERVGRQPDASAVTIARESEGHLEQRILIRAGALSQAPAVRADIGKLLRALRWFTIGLAAFGLLLGALAARATVADRQVDILLATAALLIVPTLMFGLWLVVLAVGSRRTRSGSLAGAALIGSLRWIGPRLLSSVHAADVMTAFFGAASSVWGRWRLSALTHVFWLSYALGALFTLFVFFSVVQYELSWGTTLLDDQSVVHLVTLLAAWPELLGLMQPADPGWILAGREGVSEISARAEWARFLLAMLIAWAIIPRALALLVCLALAIWAGRRMRLDTAHPGYLRLAADLQPARRVNETPGRELPPPTQRSQRARHPGAAGILAVAVELERAEADLSILAPGLALIDLGRADTRTQRKAILETVAGRTRPATAVLAVCSLLRTPDAGSERFLARLADAARSPLWLVLDEASLLVARGGELMARRRDWQALAERAGGNTVLIDRAEPQSGQLAELHRHLRLAGSGS